MVKVTKSGITRNVKENDVSKWTSKGYSVEKEPEKQKKKPKED